ncbi:unnamed protein product [Discula destructiva]
MHLKFQLTEIPAVRWPVILVQFGLYETNATLLVRSETQLLVQNAQRVFVENDQSPQNLIMCHFLFPTERLEEYSAVFFEVPL